MTQNQSASLPDWMRFVGKWGDGEVGHPLVYHLIDSAAVAALLWEHGLTQGVHNQFSNWLQLPEEDCGRLLSFWTCLHDLGKATPAFQAKHNPTKIELLSRGFDFPHLPDGDLRHHSLLSQWALKDIETDLSIPARLYPTFQIAIGGHHGTFHAMGDDQIVAQNLGGAIWQVARREMVLALKQLLDPPILPTIQLNQTARNAFFYLLTGFFVTSDWLASQDDLFHYEAPTPDLAHYLREIATPRARQALEKTGWIGWQPDSRQPEFSKVFPFTPRPLQQIVIQAAEKLHEPFLMIIEAPTGSGKTEAALVAADRAIQRGKLRGCYIAMPTQATSNQMYDRVRAYLGKRYQGFVNLQLVHGNALLNQNFQETRLTGIDPDHQNGADEGNIAAMEWFMPRKRALLAPFGVGTVDQAFISVLRARYSVLRLFGLNRKVIIFDEVHAYDTYMMEIFKRLLPWLRAVGSSVILLSATLPRETREVLAQAYQKAKPAADHPHYPRLTINDGNEITVQSLGEYPDSVIALMKAPYDPTGPLDSREEGGWLDLLRERLSDGGCAAVICNTVDRAQAVYRQIRDAGMVDPKDLFLLHARFPFCWRDEKEKEIKERFGKHEPPLKESRRGIVVATQIIEQSLDLDFDLMITDLAPIDLLIQRIGRLHRHQDRDYAPVRPEKLRDPLCLVCQPGVNVADDLPAFGNDEYVYDRAILLRTFYTLLPLQSLQLPSASDDLINQVYSRSALEVCNERQNQAIAEAAQKMTHRAETGMANARNHLIGDVDWSNVFSQSTYLDDDQAVSEATRALTRNIILPSVQLVCLTRRNGETCVLDGDIPYDPANIPPRALLPNLLRSIVTVNKQEVVAYFFSQPKNNAWKKLPAIRESYPAIFEDGVCQLNNGMRLVLDQNRGLIIEKGE